MERSRLETGQSHDFKEWIREGECMLHTLVRCVVYLATFIWVSVFICKLFILIIRYKTTKYRCQADI